MEANNSLATGTILKGTSYSYRIERTLGQGSFGITYLASVKMVGALGVIDANINVAIKEFFMRDINGRTGTNVTSGSNGGIYDDYKKKFKREALNLSILQHPNIVKVIESFEANNTVYYVMEYIGGGSLDDYILKGNGLKVDEAIKIAMQIGSALSYMHAHGMLHLDLKPSNIMMKESGDIVLIDFGLSKQYNSKGEPESSTKVGAGTPGYAPIEQANYREGKGFPVTMDVYALGGTMFKMLTGVRPPESSDILNDGFPLYELQERKISDRLSESVAKAMAPAKKDRYQTVEEFLNSFEDEVTIIDVEKSISLKSKRVHKNNDLVYYVNQKTPKVEISNTHDIVFGQVLSISEKEIEILSYDRQERKGTIKIDAGKYKLFLEDLQSLNFDLQPEGSKFDPETTGGDWRIAIRLFDDRNLVYANYWIAVNCGDCGNISENIIDVDGKLERVLKTLIGIDEKIQLNECLENYLNSSSGNKNKKDDKKKVVRTEKVKKFLQINSDTSKVRIEYWPPSLFPLQYNGAFITTVTPYEVNPNVTQESTREMIPMTQGKYKNFLNALQALKLEIREEPVKYINSGSFIPAKLKITLYDNAGVIYNDLWIDGMSGGNIVGNIGVIEKQIIQIVPGLSRYLNSPFYEVPDLIKERENQRISSNSESTKPIHEEKNGVSYRWWSVLVLIVEICFAWFMLTQSRESDLDSDGRVIRAVFIFASLCVFFFLFYVRIGTDAKTWRILSVCFTIACFANSLMLPMWNGSLTGAYFLLSIGLSIISSFTILIKKST